MTKHDEIKVYYQEVQDCDSCPLNRVEYLQLCTWAKCPLPTLADIEKLLKYVDKDDNLDVCGNCRNWIYKDFDHETKTDIGFCLSYEDYFKCNDTACDDCSPVGGNE